MIRATRNSKRETYTTPLTTLCTVFDALDLEGLLAGAVKVACELGLRFREVGHPLLHENIALSCPVHPELVVNKQQLHLRLRSRICLSPRAPFGDGIDNTTRGQVNVDRTQESRKPGTAQEGNAAEVERDSVRRLRGSANGHAELPHLVFGPIEADYVCEDA